MLFNSFSFVIFFPVVVILYYSIPKRFQVHFLLAASCVFYMAFVPWYILILFFLITIDFFLAQGIEKRTGHARRVFLTLSIISNLGTLFIFKYLNFFDANVTALAQALHWNYSLPILQFILPLGLSFHVFQSLSYVIEVYWGNWKAERNYFVYALYVMFFPQLVAGPIERPQHLLPQFRADHSWNADNAILGLERMLWGFFKKMVIADNLATIVDHIFSTVPHDGPILIVGIVLFAYQLYCDFSGYSDIAVGTARVLGFEITENFNRPYAARSIAEFWRRWHISLSSWLRDYLYQPLVWMGERRSRTKVYLSIFITFVLIGLWHGAAWTFVIMGALFGFYIVFSSITQKLRTRVAELSGITHFPRIRAAVQTLITFALVCCTWIFFRADTVSQAFSIIFHLKDHLSELFSVSYWWRSAPALMGLTARGAKVYLFLLIMAIIGLELVQYLQEKKATLSVWASWPSYARVAWRYGLIFAIVFFGYLGATPFIYFKF
jgi:D-alanyl-lipoteichoic acid acyltransferase DltB (MBOAT superfamily)